MPAVQIVSDVEQLISALSAAADEQPKLRTLLDVHYLRETAWPTHSVAGSEAGRNHNSPRRGGVAAGDIGPQVAYEPTRSDDEHLKSSPSISISPARSQERRPSCHI